MRKIFSSKIFILPLLFLYSFKLFPFESPSKLSLEAFKRAEASIEKIRKGTDRPFKFILKKVYLSEEEVNSYIHFKNPFRKPKELVNEWLYLKDDNLVEYKVKFDLTNSEIKGLPDFLKGLIEASVSGELSSFEGRVKFKPLTFAINKNPFPVSFLTNILDIYYKAKGREGMDIERWFILPYGIRKIRVEKGRVALYY
ncbi:MAG: hypothetical protein ACUVUG_09915 [Candidatus Aminicenantia bacterium]